MVKLRVPEDFEEERKEESSELKKLLAGMGIECETSLKEHWLDKQPLNYDVEYRECDCATRVVVI